MRPIFCGKVACLIALAAGLAGAGVARAEEAKSVTQYGVTWTFDRACTVGKFVTGDYWVVGPVNVVSVSPLPGVAPETDKTKVIKNQFGDASFQDDKRMRNGSMIAEKPNPSQGYDSRIINYAAELSVKFPCALKVNQSLISSISNEDINARNFVENMMWKQEKTGQFALKSAAVLTCLDKAPPADAFRPPYAGTEKPIYQAKSLHWELLPALKAPATVPSWEEYERYLQRPWLDHISNWLTQRNGPNENQPNYGREVARVGAVAGLMVCLDVPREKKEKLTLELVQLGIDLDGLAKVGRNWEADGGHWNGRKFPILFAGMMLGEKGMYPSAKTVFSEDQQTYYGKGFFGDTVLYQMVGHHGPRRAYEERSPAEWDDMDKRSEGYRNCCTSVTWVGTALAAELMGGKKAWNHDAFFDYVDRWMSKEDPYAANRGKFKRSGSEGKTMDPFVDAMWAAYRGQVPKQEGAAENLKWVWNGDKGEFAANPKGSN